ncbi:MAG: phosphatidylserine decarboxylase family protein [Muribaculaceae bacterium]|nr:phosphatidylserine decarboxylase family protein [Muribaculaceae bacterium]
MKVKIHSEGVNIILVLLFILLAINIPAYIFIGYKWVPITMIVISVVLFLLVLNFFRLPKRHFKGDADGVVVSSVDGTVVALEEVYEGEYLHRNVIQLSVFMSVFNVHANWVPLRGEVKYVKHHAGRFLAAWLPKSSTENERSAIVIKSAKNGADVLVRQIAGAIARRIVTYVEPGEQVDISDFIGFIKFGSRVDIYLPLNTEIKVKLGDKTVGGITEVARLKPLDEE